VTYVVNVPIEVQAPVSESDPDVRWLSRQPGFIRLRPLPPAERRYELRFEVEAGSVQDAADAADEMLVDFEGALDAYQPRLLAPIEPVKYR